MTEKTELNFAVDDMASAIRAAEKAFSKAGYLLDRSDSGTAAVAVAVVAAKLFEDQRRNDENPDDTRFRKWR